jgi:hypothetical protein
MGHRITLEISTPGAVVLASVLVLGGLFHADVVNAGTVGSLVSFTNGTVADADQVNSNFSDLRDEVNDNAARIVAIEAGGGGGGAGTDATRWVAFNGKFGATVNASSGVESVTRVGTGDYVIQWSTDFPDANYVVTGSCQMNGNSGAKFLLEGNNIPGNTYEGMTAKRVQVSCRDSGNNYRDSELIHVIATKHEGAWVVFDGTNDAPLLRDGLNVDRVERNSAGNYTVYWDTPFPDNDYIVVGACNGNGVGGPKFGFEGNNLAGSSDEHFLPGSVRIGCRDSTNGGRDTNTVTITAFDANTTGPDAPAAWVAFNGQTGAPVNASSNVASVDRVSAGQYRVNWATPFPDTDYLVVGTCQMQNTSGVKFGLEGNNLVGNPFEGSSPRARSWAAATRSTPAATPTSSTSWRTT